MSTSNNFVLNDVTVAALGKPLIQKIQLELKDREIYTVIGPSGTGKSTLLKVLAGLLPYQKGTITLGEKTYEAKKHVVGLVPQNYGLLPWETAYETVVSNVKISKKKKKLTSKEYQHIDRLFEAMGLTEQKNSYPSQLSGGQQQRVSLTRGFAVESDLLLLDEPFSALDAFTRESIQELFLKNWHENPTTTIFITHDIEEALLLGHKIIVMKGKPGTVIDVLDNPFCHFKTLEDKKSDSNFYSWVSRLKKELAYAEK